MQSNRHLHSIGLYLVLLYCTFLPFDRVFIPLDRIFLPFDRTFISLDRSFCPFDRTSIILSLAILHWFIPLWHFIFIHTSVEAAFHRIVTIVRP